MAFFDVIKRTKTQTQKEMKKLSSNKYFIAGTLVVMVIAYVLTNKLYAKYMISRSCQTMHCHHSVSVGRNICYHHTGYGTGYVYNALTGEHTLDGVEWIAEPKGKDSLVCYSDGKKRGYFSKNTGRVIIEPKYDHAWVFSDGLASVDDNGRIKFIDGTGKVAIDNGLTYFHEMDGYVFEGGYCVVYGDDTNVIGLMDKKGKIVLPCKYNAINLFEEDEAWHVVKGNRQGVLDKTLHPIIPLTECSLYIDNGFIGMTLPDHTMRRYDLKGNLLYDFYISSIRKLEYEKDEILYRYRTHSEDGVELSTPVVESYHPQATARLMAYVAGDGYEGLMTADGHRVTMPLYKNIEAIGYDLYLCEVSNSDKVIVNGKGEIVK